MLRARALWVGYLAPLWGGCATSLSSNQPAHVPEPGHAQSEVGFDMSIPTNSVSSIMDAAKALEEVATTRPLTDEEKVTIVRGAAFFTLNPPSVSPHMGIAYAPLRDWEVGLRLAGNSFRVASRYQVLHQTDDGFDLSLGLGFGMAFVQPPLNQILDSVQIADFSRWTLDLPIAIGQRSDWYRWWGGPRLLFSRTGQSIALSLPGEAPVQGRVDGWQAYLGATVGVAMGYDWIFMGPELTLVGLVGGADVTGLTIVDSADVTSLIAHPSFAVMMEF